MTIQVMTKTLTDHLELFAKHPAIFAGRAIHGEAYLLGLFHGLRMCDPDQPDYRTFLMESGFREHTFLSRFEKEFCCRTVLTSDQTMIDSDLEKNLHEELEIHMRAFIEWVQRNTNRRQQAEGDSKP